jgi:hypothetical protein
MARNQNAILEEQTKQFFVSAPLSYVFTHKENDSAARRAGLPDFSLYNLPKWVKYTK